MLSSVLYPIEKCPVGQHPYIIILLKGVFNSSQPYTWRGFDISTRHAKKKDRLNQYNLLPWNMLPGKQCF